MYDGIADQCGLCRPVLAVLAIVVLWAVQQADILGVGTALSRNSQAFAARVLAPWYPTATTEATAVVLFPRPWQAAGDAPLAAREVWPPDRRRILTVLQAIVRQCPKAVVVDLFFDSNRDTDDLNFPELLGTLLQTRAAAACTPAPALIFADDAIDARPSPPALEALATGRWQHRHTGELQTLLDRRSEYEEKRLEAFFAGSDLPEEPELTRFKGPAPLAAAQRLDAGDPCAVAVELAGAPRAADASEARVALAVASWPTRDLRADKYLGQRTDRVYYLTSFHNPNNGTQNGEGSHAPTGPANGRATVALAAYLAHCERGANCAARGGAAVYRAAIAFWSSHGSRCPLEPKHEAFFEAPVERVWPRWSPPGNLSFVAYGDGRILPKMGDCHPRTLPSFWDRASVSLAAALGQVPAAVQPLDRFSRGRCYPLVTLTDEQALAPPPVKQEGPDTTPLTAAQIDLRSLHDDVNRALSRKVVFVGLGDITSGRTIDSPVHGRLPGVFAHAITFDNLVHWRTSYMRPPPVAFVAFGVPIGCDALLELAAALGLGVTLIALGRWVAHSRALGRVWCWVLSWGRDARHQRLYAIGRYATAVALDLGLLLVPLVITFAASLLLTFWAYSALNWSIMNWLGISFGAVLPCFLIWRNQASVYRLNIHLRRTK